jgi:type II secretory pathway predicted ATPase ExeA
MPSFFKRSKLAEPQIASLIYNATKGIPSYIKELLTKATKMSLKAGKDSITKVEIEYVIKTFMDDKFKNHGL